MGTNSEAAELLFGRYRRQILSLLLLKPEESFYVRELERLSGMRAGPLHRELTALTQVGLVRRESSGNQVRYQANRDAPIFRELAAIFRKLTGPVVPAVPAAVEVRETQGRYNLPEPSYRPVPDKLAVSLKRLSVTARDLASFCKKWNISRMWLFGSVTRDDFRPDSDADVLVDFPHGGAPSLFGLVRLRDELSALFGGRSVDVATLAILRNPYRLQAIEPDLQIVYDAR